MNEPNTKIVEGLRTISRLKQDDAHLITTVLELIRPEDISKYDDYELLGFEAMDLDWQVVRSARTGRPVLLIRENDAQVDYASDAQETVPVRIVQRVHDGLPVFLAHVLERFPATREHCRALLTVASRLREQNGMRLELVLKSE